MLSQGNAAEALARLDRLAKELRTDRSYWLLRAQVASGLSEEAYLKAVDELVARIPELSIVSLHVMTVQTLRRNYDEALSAVAQLARRTAEDPYLDVLRAHILLQAERGAEAEKAARGALAREPELLEAYGPLLVANLRAANFTAVTDLLLETHQKFGVMYLYESEPNHAKYAASPEYARLQKATAE